MMRLLSAPIRTIIRLRTEHWQMSPFIQLPIKGTSTAVESRHTRSCSLKLWMISAAQRKVAIYRGILNSLRALVGRGPFDFDPLQLCRASQADDHSWILR